jgi:hypothetical protein
MGPPHQATPSTAMGNRHLGSRAPSLAASQNENRSVEQKFVIGTVSSTYEMKPDKQAVQRPSFVSRVKESAWFGALALWR